MPIDPSIIGAVAGGSNILDTGINAILQQKQNKANQRYATYMYDRQRADAVEDWNKQNAYNTPSAQMERLKAAQLNPHLIYGTGVQASGLSGPVRGSSAPSYKGEAPTLSLGSGLSAFIDTKMKQTQIDTLKTAQDVNRARTNQILADTILKGSQKGLLDTTSAARAFKLGLDKSMVGVTVDTASANLDKIRAQKDKIVTDTFMTMHEDIRRAMLANATTKEKLQHVALMVAQEAATRQGTSLTSDKQKQIAQQIANMEKTGELQELEKAIKQWQIDQQIPDKLRQWIGTFF